MHNVDSLIEKWRESVAPYFIGRGDVMDELESHVRDKVDALMAQGMTAESASSQ